MNEITTAEQPQAKAPIRAGVRPQGLVPTSIEEISRIARIAIDSGLVVGAYKDTVEQKLPKAMMIIMQGLELGVSPVQALNGIALINGRPSPWGKFARALVLRAGHKVDEWTTGEPYETNYTHHCKVTRGDTGQITERSFSVQDAKDAGLWQDSPTVEKKDWDNKTNRDAKKTVPNDSPWFRYKKDMLGARAFSRAAVGVADALLGMELAEVLRDVEEHRSDPEPEDRGAVYAAPPPQKAEPVLDDMAADAAYITEQGRKPPKAEPEPVKPETPPSAPKPAEEKVPEPVDGPDMEKALTDLGKMLAAAKTLDNMEAIVDTFNDAYDGHIGKDVARRVEELFEQRKGKL
jgi:hypothetical protein